MRPDTKNYLALFLEDTPLIDTRAPVEFARGAFPHAINLPLMSDDERAAVGTCYKAQGQQAAIALGHQLVSGEIRTQRLNAWLEEARRHPQGYLYCFRGGLRSQICQQWLHEAGLDYPRVQGGYKAMRQFLLNSLERLCRQQTFMVLAGHTGSAKTDLLNEMPGAVDLEGIANHRGSAFGKRADGQPSQIDFENRLIIAMLKHQHRYPGKAIVLEDESRLIGRCALPQPLRDAMAKAPLIQLHSDLDARAEHSYVNYILRKSAEWQQHAGETQGFELFIEDLRESLFRVRKRLGGERYATVSEQLESAIQAHRSGDATGHRTWILSLLRDYYDPMYDYQGQKHPARVVFRGDAQAVRQFLTSLRK
ncbi:MAG: tRNA 2-selenouridine(34) synthase MnmH [Gammaproteobacteria bacterium]|nr:tRNA 2-selenouridine(34) synthase MnmH [Gammaproteobacteria bacterium]|tara:strand:+ start:2339 stop:3433 length:1095 start_codon:yes stop_codon:yes gene_type:complete